MLPVADKNRRLSNRFILPLFDFRLRVAFEGSADLWVKPDRVFELESRKSIKIFIFSGHLFARLL